MLWQLVTYMFLHGGFFHIFFNMLTLFMFGNELERYWELRVSELLLYYRNRCGRLLLDCRSTQLFGRDRSVRRYLRSSSRLWSYYPNRIVYVNFLLPIKVKWLVIIMGAMAFLSSIGGAESGVANIAHLGGMVVGYIVLKGKEWWDKYRTFTSRDSASS